MAKELVLSEPLIPSNHQTKYLHAYVSVFPLHPCSRKAFTSGLSSSRSHQEVLVDGGDVLAEDELQRRQEEDSGHGCHHGRDAQLPPQECQDHANLGKVVVGGWRDVCE